MPEIETTPTDSKQLPGVAKSALRQIYTEPPWELVSKQAFEVGNWRTAVVITEKLELPNGTLYRTCIYSTEGNAVHSVLVPK